MCLGRGGGGGINYQLIDYVYRGTYSVSTSRGVLFFKSKAKVVLQ